MFIPLKDINPSRTYPIVNISLIIANIALFFYQLSLQFTLTPRAYAEFLSSYSTVPARLPAYLAGHGTFEMAFLPILTSMFLHSGFLHIAGNMLFLWIFGDNVEDFFGHIPYLFFYLFCGIGAALAHAFFNLYSRVPALGASGAIRSEERRVGKSVDLGGRRIIKKKKSKNRRQNGNIEKIRANQQSSSELSVTRALSSREQQ